jgi:hypothetical protein
VIDDDFVSLSFWGLPSLISRRAKRAVRTYSRKTRNDIATAAVKLPDRMLRACPANDEKIARKKLLQSQLLKKSNIPGSRLHKAETNR